MISRPFQLEFALLGFLSAGPLHGYSLHQQLGNPSGLGRVWRVKQSQLYALLEKMEAAQLVASEVHFQEPYPPRRTYTLTDLGRQAYQEWVASPVQHQYLVRQIFLAKLFFALREGQSNAIELLAAQRQVCLQWLAIQKDCAEKESAGDIYGCMVDKYRFGKIQAMLEWLDTCQCMLSESIGLNEWREP